MRLADGQRYDAAEYAHAKTHWWFARRLLLPHCAVFVDVVAGEHELYAHPASFARVCIFHDAE